MNNTEQVQLIEWNNELLRNYLVNNVFLCLYLILGISGNAVVVIIYTFRMKKKKDDRYFIPFLAVLDLCACAFRSSLELAMNVNPVNFRGSLLCKAIWFPTNISAIASICLLLVIAIQRYLKICRPFGPQMTLLWKRISLGSSLCVAVVFSIPLLFYNDEIKVKNSQNNTTGYVCDIDVKKHYGTAFLAYTITASFSSAGIMIALTIFNILIARKICKQTKAKHKRSALRERARHGSCVPLVIMNVASNVSEDIDENQVKITSKIVPNTRISGTIKQNDEYKTSCKMTFSHRYSFMFMTIGVAFIISYAPRLIMLAISLHDPKFFGKISKEELALVAFSREMNVINNVVNPYIYGFFDKTFRKETKKIFCKYL